MRSCFIPAQDSAAVSHVSQRSSLCPARPQSRHAALGGQVGIRAESIARVSTSVPGSVPRRKCAIRSANSSSNNNGSHDGDEYLQAISRAPSDATSSISPATAGPAESGESSSSSSSSSPTGQHDFQQPEHQQQQQQQSRSPEQLSLEHLRLQAAKLQALEDYQQLMAQYPPIPDSASSSGSNDPSKQHQQAAATAADVPILDAALLIAKHAHPHLDPQQVRQCLDSLAAEVAASLPTDRRYPLRIINEINRVLYKAHGFKGNDDDYYNPDNSYINKVLETKKGIPISLSIIYIEIAARLGLPMAGVNLPAHFMIRPQVEDMEWLVDAFHGGELTALEDAEEVLGRLTGYRVKLDPRFVRGDTPYFSSRQLLLRLLNNLRQIYMTLSMPEEALWIVRFMRATTPPGHLTELQRDEGMCLYELGRFHEAAEMLTDYLGTFAKDNGDTNVVMTILQRIKERAPAVPGSDDSRS